MYYNSGYSCYSGKDTKRLNMIDNDLIKLVDNYRLNKYFIPALIDGDTLRRCGYFSTLPNHLSKVGIVKRHKIQNVCDCNSIEDDDIDNSNNLFLTPAACLHIYPMLEKESVYNEIITTLARVYRYEDGNYEEGRRLWDFTVREFVAVGTFDYVNLFLKDLTDKILAYAKSYSDNIYLSEANDHFYPNKENKMKEKYQRMNKLKYEIVAKVDGKDLAITSVNYHNNHFSKEFHFDNNNEIVTGCIGCGLERWLAFVNRSDNRG